MSIYGDNLHELLEAVLEALLAEWLLAALLAEWLLAVLLTPLLVVLLLILVVVCEGDETQRESVPFSFTVTCLLQET